MKITYQSGNSITNQRKRGNLITTGGFTNEEGGMEKQEGIKTMEPRHSPIKIGQNAVNG